MDATTRCIIEGMARALFVQEWANREEEAGRTYPGKDLMKVAPKTPRKAFDAAHNLAGRLEALNRCSVLCLLARAERADGMDADSPGWIKYACTFGHYLAMEALGHGVSWFDDHARFDLVFPGYFEFNL